jgi:outer membrane protein assembly factor BamB
MAGLRDTWRRLWAEHRWLVVGVAAAVVVAVGVIAYLELRRPGDVSNPNADFTAEEKKETTALTHWPLYGLNPQRTRYLPSAKLKPPFKIKWRYDAKGLVEYSPIVVGKHLYGISNGGWTFAIRRGDGKPDWRTRVAQLNASAPAYGAGRLYMSNLEPGQVMALDAKNGKRIWRRELPGRTESSPVVVGDLVLAGCECGTLFAFKRSNGRTAWEADLGGAIKGGPAVQDGIAYVGAYGGTVAAVRISNGEIKWTSSGQSQGLGQVGNFYATPTVAFDRVYIGNTDGRMYSFERDDGDLAWSHSTGDYIYAAAVAADTDKTPPTVYVGSYDGTFYALDARSGNERWSRPAGGAVSGAASLIGDVVYVANIAKTTTVGFNVRNGKRLFIFRDGAYNPVISDNRKLFLTGKHQIYAMKPSKKSAKRPGVFGRILHHPGKGKK